MRTSIVVTGLGLITPLGSSVGETWSGFLRGESGIRRVPLFESGRYPSSYGGVVELPASLLPKHDRATRLLLSATKEAFQSAGLTRTSLKSIEKSALVLGSTLGGMASATEYVRDLQARGTQKARASKLRQMLAQTQAHELCERWGIRGESMILSDACTSGTNSLGYALRLLRRGDAEIVVAGGYDPMTEFSFAGFHSLLAIAPDLCRPFDRDREGLLLGEGAAVFILETEAHAKKRGADILGRIAGYGESADAFHITRPDPTARGAALAMQRALDDAQIQSEEIGHINAHGTGTPSNDPMEAEAIRTVFGRNAGTIPITANKAAIGHTLGAAGSIEAAITLMALHDQVVAPTLHHENADPKCEGINVLANEPKPHTMKYAMSNSFGFGGSNAALVLATA